MRASRVSIALLFVVSLLAAPAMAGTGASCEKYVLSVGASSKVMDVLWCGPSEASVGSEFMLTGYVQITSGSLVISLEDPADWELTGCSMSSSSDRDGGLSESSIAIISMDTDTCTITAYAAEGLLTDAVAVPFLWSVYDPNYSAPTDFNISTLGGSQGDVLDLLTIVVMVAVAVLIWTKTEPVPLRFGGAILLAVAGLLCFELVAIHVILVPLGVSLMALGAYAFYEIPQSDKSRPGRDPFDLGPL